MENALPDVEELGSQPTYEELKLDEVSMVDVELAGFSAYL